MITQEGVHNVLVEAMSPVEKVKLSAACNNDPDKIKAAEQKMADILNAVVDIAVNPGTLYMNTKVIECEGSNPKLKGLRKFLEENIEGVPAKDLSIEALLSIIYSKHMTGLGPSMIEILSRYAEYMEEFLSAPSCSDELAENRNEEE